MAKKEKKSSGVSSIKRIGGWLMKKMAIGGAKQLRSNADEVNKLNVFPVPDGDTGDIDMVNLIAEGTLSVERSTGNVKFDGCDASEIFVETDTGDVKGSLLSEKLFITETDTGRVEVPHSVEGGRCEIYTDTGDIKISIK